MALAAHQGPMSNGCAGKHTPNTKVHETASHRLLEQAEFTVKLPQAGPSFGHSDWCGGTGRQVQFLHHLLRSQAAPPFSGSPCAAWAPLDRQAAVPRCRVSEGQSPLKDVPTLHPSLASRMRRRQRWRWQSGGLRG